jgi:hypothetical protein
MTLTPGMGRNQIPRRRSQDEMTRTQAPRAAGGGRTADAALAQNRDGWSQPLAHGFGFFA